MRSVFSFSKKHILYVLLFTFILILAQQWIRYEDRQVKRYMELFDNADINGRIRGFFSLYKGTGLQIVGDSNEYLFYAVGGRSFFDVAEVGDSIRKKRYSDSFYLFKKNEVIGFYFHRQFK